MPGPRTRSGAGADLSTDRPNSTPLVFVQPTGDSFLHWTVVEVDARGVPGARGASCLVFTRLDCIRRVWTYPADWRALDVDALIALSWGR
jgi:hypothetical protein